MSLEKIEGFYTLDIEVKLELVEGG